ncbi:hypothetical protein L798_08172 [Zootermopsis nevadensis]|uniref:ATP-dependent DNA helicase PIF1 n=1 Tax=Zootermopsis nevadensis TaxID=136037 RepID=A0A067R480_ZOONE|nr:hypothetical protein L798_08172 [Zootermopsis nevadensis]
MTNNLLQCMVTKGDHSGEIVFIPRIKLYCKSEYPFTMWRRQFPVTLAFVITINEAQGQTFKPIGICLEQDAFAHGQIYVAF